MKMQLVLGYKDLFEGECPSINELTAGTPTKAIIAYWSTVTNIIELREDTPQIQLFIYKAISQNFPQDIAIQLGKRLVEHERKYKVFCLFADKYVVGFLYRVLRNFQDFKQEIVPENEELNIFKAYLCYVDDLNKLENDKLAQILDNQRADDKEWFGKMIWPYLIKQFEFTYPTDILYEGLKGMALLTFLQKHENYKPYLNKFLEQIKSTDVVQYIGGLIQLIQANFAKKDEKNFYGYIQLFIFNDDDPVLNSLIYKPQTSRTGDPEKSDYLDLKERPLVHFQDNQYVVPYWNYVYQAMFLGLLFAFYKSSGVRELKRRFDDFTSDIASEFSEKWLFRKLMTTCFTHKYKCLAFPEIESFNPDCYFRHNHTLYLFEFKDSLLNKDVIHSFSYEEIKSAINTKLAQKASDTSKKNKGIYQLARLLRSLKIEFNNAICFDQQAINSKIKARQITIYPIVVHTNRYFDLPGVNQYLEELFSSEVIEAKSNFRAIKPLTVINLQYFFQRMQLFRDKVILLDEELDYYQRELVKRRKRTKKTNEVNDIMDMYPSFHEFVLGSEQLYKVYKQDEMVKSAFECWDLPRKQ